ncbi:MAG: hypothetical protein JRJ27_11115 [Deltaproteobacteria bacterium]|nr:hypothetical protein [Deltaproteobacteria bacterium]
MFLLNVKHEGKYDAELNIVFVKFINKPLSIEDVDYVISENERWFKKGGKNKVWGIADVSEMGVPPPKMIKDFQKKEQLLADKYVIDSCVFCPNPFERIATQLFNVIKRKKHPIFKTMEEAIEWVRKEQETRGRFEPL